MRVYSPICQASYSNVCFVYTRVLRFTVKRQTSALFLHVVNLELKIEGSHLIRGKYALIWQDFMKYLLYFQFDEINKIIVVKNLLEQYIFPHFAIASAT